MVCEKPCPKPHLAHIGKAHNACLQRHAYCAAAAAAVSTILSSLAWMAPSCTPWQRSQQSHRALMVHIVVLIVTAPEASALLLADPRRSDEPCAAGAHAWAAAGCTDDMQLPSANCSCSRRQGPPHRGHLDPADRVTAGPAHIETCSP